MAKLGKTALSTARDAVASVFIISAETFERQDFFVEIFIGVSNSLTRTCV